jgi:pyruvate dehydrogenase (quinone)
MAQNAADILVECLIAGGIRTVFGLPGDGINGIMEALRTRQGRIRFIQVRHEEAAAFMAVAHAKWTGEMACCLATSGPGGVHLLNGLYDGKYDGVPVLAITGLPFHDLIGTATQQDVELDHVLGNAAAYSARIMSVTHVRNAAALALRTAWARRGVAHLSIPVDVQEQTEEEGKPSDRNVAPASTIFRDRAEARPPDEALDRAARLLDDGRRVAILAGQGALRARPELRQTATLLGAPVVKALLGKEVIPDDDPLTTGGIGLFGTRPSQDAFDTCDTLLIVGSTFPYIEYYPKPGQARVVQIDIDAARIGLRYPVEVGLVGDAAATLKLLNARLKRRADLNFLRDAQDAMIEWRKLRDRIDTPPGHPLKPQQLARQLGRRLKDDAIIACDSGFNTGLCARDIELRAGQRFAVSGSMASMACGLPYAIAAALAFPGRQVIAFVGDGGLSMLMGELATCVRYKLPIKIVVVKNNTLGQIKWEQMLFLGNPEYECDLQPIDFAKVAEAVGLKGFRIEAPEQCEQVLDAALAEPGAALVEASVDPNEPLLPPKRKAKFVDNLEKALSRGTPGADDIRRALKEEPARALLEP